MKRFELSSKKKKNGRREFKIVLCEIHPDSCVDEEKQVGTEYNKNGITWIKEYCEKALPTIKGMPLRCEFIDEDRTEILGHGDTGVIDGVPIYEDAVTLGTCTKGYIDTVNSDKGEIVAVIAEGEIDAQCYHNFVEKLDNDIKEGIYPSGSVEIMHTENNDSIIYKYGYKELGRIPMEFDFSGYALLGVEPADDSAKLIELNRNKEDVNTMTELEIKNLVAQTVTEMSDHQAEINKCKEECEKKIAETNAELEKVIAEKNEIAVNSEQIQAALDQCKAERVALDKKYDELWEEKQALEKALGEAKAKERIADLNNALSEFTDVEQNYAKEEIEAFNADPNSCEINSIVDKIWQSIGKAAKTDETKKAAEQNSNQKTSEDIFGEINSEADDNDTNIF